MSNIREIIGMHKENNNTHTLQHLKDSLIYLGGDEQLLMYLIGAGGIDTRRVIFTSQFFLRSSVPVYK